MQADVFVNLGPVITTERLMLYGVRDRNWIEAKAFLSSVRVDAISHNCQAVIADTGGVCQRPSGKVEIVVAGKYILNEPYAILLIPDVGGIVFALHWVIEKSAHDRRAVIRNV